MNKEAHSETPLELGALLFNPVRSVWLVISKYTEQ
jgi:hypothetical protein